MDVTEIANMISSVGFPIVMCIILFKYMEKNDDKREREANEMREAINNNTQVMNSLLENIRVWVSQLTQNGGR